MKHVFLLILFRMIARVRDGKVQHRITGVKMKKYSALLLLVLVFLSACGSEQAATETDTADVSSQVNNKVYHWRLAESWPTNFPIFDKAAKQMAEDVKRMSQGRLIISVDSANKHKAPLGVFDMVKAGQYQMGHSASYYWKGKDFNTVFFTTMPFGLIAPERYAWFYYGGGKELMHKVYDKYGMISLPGGNTGNQMGGWFRKEINSLDDLHGLKMRIPGFAGEIFAKVGAKPTNIPAGELYTSLERNTIDALEWAGPALDLGMGFHKIAPYYYTGWHEPASELQYLINKKAFDELPEDLQLILTNATRVAAFDMFADITHENGVNLEKIKTEFPDVKIRSFPKEVLRELEKANDELLDEFAAKDPLTKEIVDSLRAYKKRMRAWTKISEQAYLESTEIEGSEIESTEK